MTSVQISEMLQYCLKNKLFINRRYNNTTRTPLLHAIEAKDLECVKILVRNGARVSYSHLEVWINPLVVAAEKNCFEICKFLLEVGACPNDRGEGDKYPIFWAIHHRNLAMVRLLLDKGTTVSLSDSLVQAICLDNLEIATEVVRAAVDVNKFDSFGNLPVMSALHHRNLEMLKFLDRAGANLDQPDLNNDTPLMKCARTGNFPMAKYLVKRGVNVNAQTMIKETALSLALMAEDFRTAQLLIEAGARMELAQREIQKAVKTNPDFGAYLDDWKKQKELKEAAAALAAEQQKKQGQDLEAGEGTEIHV